MKFIIPYKKCKLRFGSIWIEGKTKYISHGTYIFYGAKTFLVNGTIPDIENKDVQLEVIRMPTKFDSTYYDVSALTMGKQTYKYERVSA